MKQKRLGILLVVLLLVGCATPTPQIIKETVIVTQPPYPTYTLPPTYTPYPTCTPPPTYTPYPTPTQTATSTNTPAPTPTNTPTPKPTDTPPPTNTPTPTNIPTTPAPTLAPTRPIGLLDDFEEDSKDKNAWGGVWYEYNDSDNGGTSTVVREIIAPGANGTDHALRMRGQVTTAFEYGYIGIGTHLVEDAGPRDISGYTAVSFWARGDGKRYRIRLESDSVKDYDYYGYIFEATSGWRLVRVPFDQLSQECFGAKVSWTGTDIVKLSFQTVGQPHKSVQLDIDDIIFTSD